MSRKRHNHSNIAYQYHQEEEQKNYDRQYYDGSQLEAMFCGIWVMSTLFNRYVWRNAWSKYDMHNLGPVVQSIVSLTSLLMTNQLAVLAKVFSNTMIFLLQNVSSFCNAKATHIYAAKNIKVFAIFQDRNFNITLANNFVKFWTNGPWCWRLIWM